MRAHLAEPDLCNVHQRIHLKLRALEVLNAKGVDGDHLHAALVAHFEDACQRLKAQVVALGGLHAVAPGKPAVPVHDKGHMPRHLALLQRPNARRLQRFAGPEQRREAGHPAERAPARIGHRAACVL